jgi:hypothetical protein
VGSIFVIDAKDRAAVHAFTHTDPYCVNSVWDKVQIHGYNKKRGEARHADHQSVDRVIANWVGATAIR